MLTTAAAVVIVAVGLRTIGGWCVRWVSTNATACTVVCIVSTAGAILALLDGRFVAFALRSLLAVVAFRRAERLDTTARQAAR